MPGCAYYHTAFSTLMEGRAELCNLTSTAATKCPWYEDKVKWCPSRSTGSKVQYKAIEDTLYPLAALARRTHSINQGYPTPISTVFQLSKQPTGVSVQE